MLFIRQIFLVLSLSVIIFLILFITYSTKHFSLTRPGNIKRTYHKNATIIDTPGCTIPFWQPFDATVAHLFKKRISFQCPGRISFLYTLPNGSIGVNEDILHKHYDLNFTNIRCRYRPISRLCNINNKNIDKGFKIGKSNDLQFGKSIKDEFIVVNCNVKKNKDILEEYLSIFPNNKQPNYKKKKAKNVNLNIPIEPMNIIILGIDSISKLNFIRHFTKTRRFLQSVDAIELHGYTKVGDNTFPNLTPFLTGHFAEHYYNTTVRKSYFFDDLEFIWKDYAEHGYTTLFAEDAPKMATYNYYKLGFKSPPTNFYYRPMALAMEYSKKKNKDQYHCFGSKREIEVLYDYLRKFVYSYNSPNLFFSFVFVARLTHNYLNNAGYADQPTFNLLKDLQNSGIFNNSVFILFSDHGIRFGDILETYIGKFEERMPMAFLVFPPWFYAKYPMIYKNLKINEKRLTTPFDIHATLFQFLDITSISPVNNFTINDYGYSLFGEIPNTRTCEDAGILPHWCTCQTHTAIDSKLETVTNAAHVLLDTINDWLKDFQDCMNLVLSKILDARVWTPNKEVLSNTPLNKHCKSFFAEKITVPKDFLLTVRALPGGGIFEGTIRYYSDSNTYKVLDDVSRINKYGNQSYCIQDDHLQKYCYCKDQV